MQRTISTLLLLGAALLVAPLTATAVTIQWTPVGNPGNLADTNVFGGRGAVSYAYSIGTYDITNSQYAEFLNTKDPTGANSLAMWNTNMANATFGGISFNSGNVPGSRYVVTAGRENHPVNYETLYSAMRFTNWVNNGQGSGDTETGAYTFGTLGAAGVPVIAPLFHAADAKVWLPTDNEWYKAAYYDPNTNGYNSYPTGSNLVPNASGPTATANSANYHGAVGNLTDVGEYTGTTSPYGAFDMGGNVLQWVQAVGSGGRRGVRGGAFNTDSSTLLSSAQDSDFPTSQGFNIGFRLAGVVVDVPEPSTGVLALVACGLLCWWRKRFK